MVIKVQKEKEVEALECVVIKIIDTIKKASLFGAFFMRLFQLIFRRFTFRSTCFYKVSNVVVSSF